MEEDAGIGLVVRRERKCGKHGMGLMGIGMGMIGVGVNGNEERKDSEMERVWVVSKGERVKESVWLVWKMDVKAKIVNGEMKSRS